MKPTPIRTLILLLPALLLAGCGSTILTLPDITRPYPAKRPPSSARVPGTQRPYVINNKTYYPLPTSEGYEERGLASWYGNKFHGRKTANGETYNMHAATAAHKTLPMNTQVLVRNLENRKETVVRINDRGPFVSGRIIDLSLTAARRLDIVKQGTARVELVALGEAVTYGQGSKKIERFLPHQDFEKGEFFIQIGSFENLAYANNLRDQMVAWGKKVVIQSHGEDGPVYYRVRVVAGSKLDEAKRLARVLSEAGFPGFVIAK